MAGHYSSEPVWQALSDSNKGNLIRAALYAYARMKGRYDTVGERESANIKCRTALEGATRAPLLLLATTIDYPSGVQEALTTEDREAERDTRLLQLNGWLSIRHGNKIANLAVSSAEREEFKAILDRAVDNEDFVVDREGLYVRDGLHPRIWWALWRKISNRR